MKVCLCVEDLVSTLQATEGRAVFAVHHQMAPSKPLKEKYPYPVIFDICANLINEGSELNPVIEVLKKLGISSACSNSQFYELKHISL